MAMDKYASLVLTFDKVTGAMKFTGQEAVSLQKQVRLLRQELTLGSYTADEFKKIQAALQETELKLKQTQLRGKDLFEQIGTLGGPIGEFSNRIDRSLKLLNALASMSFEELKAQFRTLGALIGLIDVEDISAEIQSIPTPGGRTQRESTGNAGEAGDAMRQRRTRNVVQGEQQAAAATAATTAAINAQTEALIVNGITIERTYLKFKAGEETIQEFTIRTGAMRLVLDEIEETFGHVNTVIEDGVAKIAINDAAMRELTTAEIMAVTSGEKLIITEEGIIATQAKAATSTKILTAITTAYGKVVAFVSGLIQVTFTTALRTADIAAKILVGTLTLLGAAIGGLLLGGQVIGPLIEWATGFAEAAAEAENLKTQLDAIKKVLDLDLNDLRRRSAEGRAEMEKNNATSKQLRAQDLKDAKDKYNLLTNALQEAREKQAKIQADSQKKGGFFGVSKEAAEQQAKNVEEAANLVLDLEQKQKDAANDINVKGNKNIEATTKEGINNRIKAIDAEIEQQIESRTTETKELLRLYKERNNLVDFLDKDHTLTTIEEAERRRIQNKKINDAIVDDNLRVLQSNADIIARQIETVERGSGEEYELRRNLAKANREIAFQEAKRDEKTRENNEKNANTKLATDLIEIDKMYWKDKMELRQTELNSLYEGTAEFYDKERELEQESYRLKIVEARNNAKLIEAINEEHKRRLLEIDAKEIDAKADIEERKANVAMVSLKTEEVGFLESFKVIREANKQKFQDLTDSENLEYEARKIRAAGNNEQLELLQKEHVLKLGEIEVQRVTAAQQVNQVIIDSTAQFGNALGQITAAIMENAQGRNEAQFENTKAFAKGAVIIEKAAAIGQIWSNNAVANAKAVAAFPLTGGQPWVTINTVTAAISSVATAGAAAKAISEIENRKFEKNKESKMPSGRNYAMGGYIDGPRHSQGGVPLEAEGGEAIMTRGAVTAFAPLLSAINQMGGGTSFSQGAVGQAGYDFPTPPSQQVQQAQITKTYVVENELTTIQQRQARLKDLSTL